MEEESLLFSPRSNAATYCESGDQVRIPTSGQSSLRRVQYSSSLIGIKWKSGKLKVRKSNLLHKTFPEGYLAMDSEDCQDRFPLDVDETIWWPTNGMELKDGNEGH